jgi:hypothetical protein
MPFDFLTAKIACGRYGARRMRPLYSDPGSYDPTEAAARELWALLWLEPDASAKLGKYDGAP